MANAMPIDQQLAALNFVRADPTSETSKSQLTAGLSNKSNLIAARAATIIAETNQANFLTAIEVAFDRFFKENSDKGCPAKTALANAMYTLGHNDPAPFLRGIHHVQKEASFGPSVDVAAELRGLCALGLTRMGYPDILLELAELLLDNESQARHLAARAVAYTGSPDGAPLLKMKILAGDTEADVTAECFIGLMKLSPVKCLPFVRRFLKTDESAAIAIASTKTVSAFEILKQEWELHIQPEPRRSLLLAIAMTRQPAAIEFLLERIADDRPTPAADAITALGLYKHDQTLKEKVQALLIHPDHSAAFDKSFT